LTPNFLAANRISRCLILRAAARAAMPFISVPAEAAVAEVFGTLPVLVALILMRSRSIRNSSATICATLIISPWPISVPPWFKCTLPSL